MKKLHWPFNLLAVGVLVLGVVGLVRAQKPTPKKPSAPAIQHTVDPEEQWACGLGTRRDRNGEHCQCPAMVAEVREEQTDACYHGDPKGFDACMTKASLVSECDIVKNADLKHPVHTCNRSCSTKAICRCHDGPACHLPPLSHFSEEEDQQ